jgi:hypothetical protein
MPKVSADVLNPDKLPIFSVKRVLIGGVATHEFAHKLGLQALGLLDPKPFRRIH